MSIDSSTESSEDEDEDVGSVQSSNKEGQPMLSQNVHATSVLFSTETEDNATRNDDDSNWASKEEEAEATSDCSKDEGPDTNVR